MINLTYLVVDGKWAEELHRYTLRWVKVGTGVEPNEGFLPVLYHDGKRVVKPWRLALTARIEEDPDGGNANTG